MAAQDSDTEDEEEVFMRRRTTPKQMDLGVLPSGGGLRKWVNGLIAEALRCSNRSKTRTLKFIQAALAASSPSEVQRVSPRWDAFDTELSCALAKIAKGAIGRKVLLHQEQCLRDMRTATGSELLVIIVRHYELTYGQALQVDMQTLMSLSFKGKLEEFLDNLDASLSRMTREPDDALLLTIVEPLLRQAPELEMDFNVFDRAAPGSFESTLGFLYTAARAACERKRRQEMLQSMLPAPPKQVAPIIKSKPKGKYLMAFTGVVKKYFAEKGFGFVTPDDGGADVFVHVRDNPELQDCEIGTAVTYDSEFDDRRGKYKGINCCPSDGCAAWHYEEEDDEQEAEIDLSSCLWEPPPPGTWVQVLFDDGHWYWGRLQEDCGGTQAVIGYHTGPLTGDYGQVDFEVDYVWKPDPDAHAGADDACDDEADQETGLLDVEYDEGTDGTDHGPDPLGVD